MVDKCYICACIGEFAQTNYDGDEELYIIVVKSPFQYDTPELAKNDVSTVKFQKCNGHIVLVIDSDDDCHLRDGKTNVIEWNNWMQYYMAHVNKVTGEEEPCADNWDDLFGVDSVPDDFEQIVNINSVSVFSYEDI